MFRSTLSAMNKSLRHSRKHASKINKFFISGNPLKIKLNKGMPKSELIKLITSDFNENEKTKQEINDHTVIYNISNPKIGIPKLGGVMVIHIVHPILYIDALSTPSTHPEKKKTLIQISKDIASDHKLRMIRADCSPELKDIYIKEGFTIEQIKRESYSSSNNSNSNGSTESYNNTNIIGFTMTYVPRGRNVNRSNRTRSKVYRFPSP
jgi:hypothetical protein